MGDHNFCRNPEGVVAPQVWLHTTDHEVLFQYVSSLLPPSEKLLICCWTMIGKENRASYDNLKTETYLSLDEINMLWLSLVLYTNTDQQQTTRLGENWEGDNQCQCQTRSELDQVYCAKVRYSDYD